MIRDLVEGGPGEIQAADVCIVGAGAAGIVLAVELARHGKRVFVLEGGGARIEPESQEPYHSEIVGQKHNGIHEGRFRASGGTTTRWGGQILELDAGDFEKRDWIPGSGWPIAKRDLAEFYARAIKLEGLGGATLDDAAVWRQLDCDMPEFASLESYLSRWCPEPNFACLHADALNKNPAITVWLHANAVAPLIEGDRIRGIRCKTLTSIETTFHADQFVWCMGGIESSRFFLQPELASLPWNRSGLLGRHFQDHVVCASAQIKLVDQGRFHNAFDNIFLRGHKYQPKIRLPLSLQQKHGTLNIAGLISFKSESEEVGGEIKTTVKKVFRGRFQEISGREVSRLIQNAPLFARQSWRYARQHRAYIAPDADIALDVFCEQLPEGPSSIQLAEERDSLGMLRTRLNWKVSDVEINSIQTFVKIVADSFQDMANVVPDSDLIHDPDTFRSKCSDSYHHMGGMRMSSSPANGVVDTNLKLHGIDNGYVCSAAVFPTSGYSNPTHTVLALAVRLATHLGQQ